MNRRGAIFARALPCVLRAALALSATAPCAAQITVEKVEIGWGGDIVPERWNPVTLLVTGGPSGFSGTVSVSFTQDATQPGLVMAPIAATPGVQTRVSLAAPLAARTDGIRVTVADGGGRVVYRDDPAAAPAGGPGMAMAWNWSRPPQIVLVAPGASAETLARVDRIPIRLVAPQAVQGWGGGSPQQTTPEIQRDELWQEVSFVGVPMDQWPASPTPLDSVTAVVIRASSAVGGVRTGLTERQAAAIERWVRGGGTLVLLADDPGDAWRRFVMLEDGSDAVTLAERSRLPLPAEAATALERFGLPLEIDAVPVGAADAPGVQVQIPRPPANATDTSPSPTREPIPAAADVPTRLVTPTPGGRREGWRVLWHAGDDSQTGSLAAGPVGFGRVIVVGFDPQATPAVVSQRATEAVWRTLLEAAVLGDPDSALMRSFGGFSPSGSTPQEQAAISQVLDTAAVAPRWGLGYLVMIGVCMAALTLLVGVVDFVVLRSLGLRHRAWASALLWIGLASAAAYLAPLVFRRGEARADRMGIVDAILAPDGSTRAAAQTVLTALAAEATTIATVSPPDGALVRGVSPVSAFRSTPVFTTARMIQRPDTPGTLIAPLRLPQWTFRALMEVSTPRDVPRVRVRSAGETEDSVLRPMLEVEIDALPHGATLARTGVEHAGRFSTLTIEPAPPGSGAAFIGRTGAWFSRPGVPIGQSALSEVDTPRLPPATLTYAPTLPGAANRGVSMLARADDGAYAVVVLDIAGLPPDAGVEFQGVQPAASRRMAYRLAAPMPRGIEEPSR